MKNRKWILATVLAFTLVLFAGCAAKGTEDIDWISTDIPECGISVTLPKETTVVDDREKGGSLVFVSNDNKEWTLSIMTIDVTPEIASTLLTDATLAESLKTGYKTSVGELEFLIDEVTTLNDVEVLNIKYQYTKDSVQTVDDHVVFSQTYTKSGKIIDIMLSYSKDSDIVTKIKEAIVFTN